MYKRVLLAYDGSESGQKALLNCRDIAQWSHSELFLVAIMPSPINVAVDGVLYDSGSDAETERKRYEEILADGLKRLSEAGHAASGDLRVGTFRLEQMSKLAVWRERGAADLIVVGGVGTISTADGGAVSGASRPCPGHRRAHRHGRRRHGRARRSSRMATVRRPPGPSSTRTS